MAGRCRVLQSRAEQNIVISMHYQNTMKCLNYRLKTGLSRVEITIPSRVYHGLVCIVGSFILSL